MRSVTSATELKVALIGLGGVAEPHLLGYRTLHSVRIVGVVEPRAERLKEITERYQVRGYATCDDLLAETRPDVACILTPAATHRALAERCAAAGVHVLCEKPMAVTLDDAIAMARACEQSGVRFFYGSSYRYLPAVQKARALIKAGRIGEVRLITEHLVGGSGAKAYRPMSAEHYPPGGPGGGGNGLVDHGIHMLDIFPWLCGSAISSVLGRGDRTGGIPLPEFALLSMANGAIGVLTYDDSTRSADLPWEGIFSEGNQWVDGRGWVGERGRWEHGAGSIRVHGSEGSLRIFHYANKLFINHSGQAQEILTDDGTTPDHFGRQLEAFRTNLQRDEPPATSAGDGIRALRALHAIYDSERERQWQPLPPEGTQATELSPRPARKANTRS